MNSDTKFHLWIMSITLALCLLYSAYHNTILKNQLYQVTEEKRDILHKAINVLDSYDSLKVRFEKLEDWRIVPKKKQYQRTQRDKTNRLNPIIHE